MNSDQDKDQLQLDRLDIADAAARLGLSIDAVRKRVQRGTLQAEKVENRWYVVLPVQNRQKLAHDARQDYAHPCLDTIPDTIVGEATSVLDTAKNSAPNVQDGSGHALAVLSATFTSALEGERQRSSAAEQAAAMWQERARNLEAENDRLQALLALPAHVEEPELPYRPWWRRLWRRSEA